MDFVDNVSENIKNTYYFFEDKWYDVLDKIDEKVPVYNVIDKVDEVIPSFILFLLIILFFIILLGYFIQFSSPIEITFTTIDATTTATLGGVNIRTIALNESREGLTNNQGILKVNFEERAKNIYHVIMEMLTGTKEVDLTIELRADKSGYIDFVDTFYSGREHTLKLSPIPIERPDDGIEFKSQTTVRLIDSRTKNTIIDNTNSAYVEFNCYNKTINNKRVYSTTGSFELNESDCHFRVVEAYSPGYSRSTNTRLLPTTQDSHTIELNKIVTTGTAKIWVFEDGNFDNPISGAEVVINGKSSTTNNGGLATITELSEGEYEIFVSKDDYYSISSSDEITINITANQTSEKEIFLTPMDPELRRRIYLQVVDLESNNPISGVSVTLREIMENNTTGSAMQPIRSTDINGLFENKTLSVNNENKIVAVLEKEDYVIKVIKPELFELDKGPQIVELEKIKVDNDSDGNPFYSNSGFAKVTVKGQSGDLTRNLQNAIVNILIEDINGIRDLPISPRTTGQQGNVIFSGLPIDLNYLAKATYENTTGQSDSSKYLDANKTIEFEIILNLDNSKIIINLQNELGEVITDANISLYQANENFKEIEFKEKLQEIQNQYHSRFYSREKNYHISIKASGYITEFITINHKENPLKGGLNEFNKTLKEIRIVCSDLDEIQCNQTPGCTWENDICKTDVADDPTNGKIIIDWKDIYNLEDKLWDDVSTANIIYDKNTYRAQISIEINRVDIDYNALLAMIRTENAIIQEIKINPQLGNKLISLASCSNSQLDNDSLRTKTYYIRDGLEGCLENNKILAGAKWSEKEIENKNYLPKGTYSIAIDFTVNDTNEVIFWFRAKEERVNDWSETNLHEKRIPVGVPFRQGIFLEAKINQVPIHFSNSQGSTSINDNEPTNLEIIINNKGIEPLTNGKVTVYSHRGSISSFNASADTLRGDVLFGEGETFNQKNKVLGENIIIAINDLRKLETLFKVEARNTSNYLVIVFEYDGEKETYFIGLNTTGRRIRVRHAEFLSGVTNQLFSGNIVPRAGFGDPVIESAKISVFREDETTVHSNLPVIIKENGNEFEVQIPGNYISGDYLYLNIVSKERGTNEMYEPFNERFIAGAHGTSDRSLACIDIYNDEISDKFINLEWDTELRLNITNRCNDAVILFVETALVCKYEDEVNCSNYKTLQPQEIIQLNITGKNITYASDKETPNFTDILGYFPVNVKARFVNRNIFSNASSFSINLINNKQCFEYVGLPILDFRENDQHEVKIINHCYYRDITNYFIPKIDLRAFGYDLNPTQEIGGINNISFNVSLALDGPTRSFETKQRQVENMVGITTVYAEDLESQKIIPRAGDLAKYIVSFDLSDSLASYNNTIEGDWYYNRLQIRIIDNDGLSNYYGGKIDGSIKLTFDDGTTSMLSPAGNFELNKFRAVSGGANMYSGAAFWGEGFLVGLGPDNLDGDWHAGIFYQSINNRKISQIDINFIGVEPNNGLNEFLEFSVRPQIKYTETYYQETTSGSSDTSISLGNYSIPRIGGVGFILKSMSDLEEEAFFEKEEFLSRVNPKLSGIQTDNEKIMVWVENGFLFAGYLGDSPYISTPQNTLSGSIIKRIGTTNIYGLLNVIDYVIQKPGERIISGDAA